MLRDGVADPAYVVKSAVYAGISSAALALTVDTLIHPAKPERAALPEPARKKTYNTVPKGVEEK
jgi:chaperonin GroEL (HSP60 family)